MNGFQLSLKSEAAQKSKQTTTTTKIDADKTNNAIIL